MLSGKCGGKRGGKRARMYKTCHCTRQPKSSWLGCWPMGTWLSLPEGSQMVVECRVWAQYPNSCCLPRLGDLVSTLEAEAKKWPFEAAKWKWKWPFEAAKWKWKRVSNPCGSGSEVEVEADE